MTSCVQTFSKISLGQNMCMPCLLQVYAWKIVCKHKIIFLGKKQKPKPKPDIHLKFKLSQKKCRTSIKRILFPPVQWKLIPCKSGVSVLPGCIRQDVHLNMSWRCVLIHCCPLWVHQSCHPTCHGSALCAL